MSEATAASRRQPNPRDPVGAAALRFLLEVISWVAIFFVWGWPVALAAILALGVFSTPGDKRRVFVPTPGPLRLLIEVGIFVLGCVAAWLAAGWMAGVGVSLLFVAYLLIGRRRLVWLARGAPRA